MPLRVQDHYENMYCVLAGEKRFTLLPPSDVSFLYERVFPVGRFTVSDGQWRVQHEVRMLCAWKSSCDTV